MVIMIDGSRKPITNLKLILYCFEWLTGLRINYHKSEVYGFGASQGEKEEMTNMLNCVLGELPMKYLGIPISDHHLSMGAFGFLSHEMVSRLNPWKGRFLTSGENRFLPTPV
jgi:hypothetical protein